MTNVIDLPVVTTLDLNPNRLLEKAKDKLESVVIMGWTPESEFYFASSKSDAEFTIFLCEKAKYELFKIMEEMENGNA